jgi:hypothetical protein
MLGLLGMHASPYDLRDAESSLGFIVGKPLGCDAVSYISETEVGALLHFPGRDQTKP